MSYDTNPIDLDRDDYIPANMLRSPDEIALEHGDEPDNPAVPLQFYSLATVAEQVRNAPPPGWLIRGIWPDDAYGVLGAEDKAGKSWAALDLAVAVASGRRFLNHWDTETPGPVLVFFGEGSERKVVRRLHAIGAAAGLTEDETDQLPIRLSFRAPALTKADHLALFAAELAQHPARLVILDPLYLALGDVETSNLARMGEALGNAQYVAQEAGAALLIVHHWNQTGTGTGRQRFSGAGLAEWGRILASMSVLRRSTDTNHPGRSVVDLKLELVGDEIADTEATFRRTVWSDDPSLLGSPMHYEIERTVLDPTERAEMTGSEYDAALAARTVLFDLFTSDPNLHVRSRRELHQKVRDTGQTFSDRAVNTAAGDLAATGFLTAETGPRGAIGYRRKTEMELEP